MWPDVPNVRLLTLSRYFRTRVTPIHRALDDAIACAEVLDGLLGFAGRLGILTLGDLHEAVRARGRPHFGKIRLADDLPNAAGVYRFVGRDERVLYVGKARDLRSRVKSYFYGDERKKIEGLLGEVRRVEGEETPGGELEALVLEARLIRSHEPKYNRRGKTWRRFAYLKVDPAEAYPRVKVVFRAARTTGASTSGRSPAARRPDRPRRPWRTSCPSADARARWARARDSPPAPWPTWAGVPLPATVGSTPSATESSSGISSPPSRPRTGSSRRSSGRCSGSRRPSASRRRRPRGTGSGPSRARSGVRDRTPGCSGPAGSSSRSEGTRRLVFLGGALARARRAGGSDRVAVPARARRRALGGPVVAGPQPGQARRLRRAAVRARRRRRAPRPDRSLVPRSRAERVTPALGSGTVETVDLLAREMSETFHDMRTRLHGSPRRSSSGSPSRAAGPCSDARTAAGTITTRSPIRCRRRSRRSRGGSRTSRCAR